MLVPTWLTLKFSLLVVYVLLHNNVEVYDQRIYLPSYIFLSTEFWFSYPSSFIPLTEKLALWTKMNTIINVNQSLFLTIDKFNETFYNVCYASPPTIVSDGLWVQIDYRKPMKASLPLLELQMLIIFCITQFFHFFLKHLDFPLFVPQVIVSTLLRVFIS